MDIVAFQVFCIEYYSEHIQVPGNEVYAMFRDSDLLKMLEEDYEDLHGMGAEALMQFFDQYFGKEAC